LSYPFIIWTFQRTGGTTLSAALSNSISTQGVKHEPFNMEREYGSITRTINENRLTEGALLLDQVLDSAANIKHCFELHSRKFNTLFLDRLSKRNDYRHVILMREAEVDRLCSLYLAKQTAVWGKWKADKGGYDDILQGNLKLEPFPVDEMLKHSKHCLEYRKWLVQALQERNLSFKEVLFEDIYRGTLQERKQKANELFEFVGANYDENNKEVVSRLLSGGQKSNKLFSLVPDFESTREFLTQKIAKTTRTW